MKKKSELKEIIRKVISEMKYGSLIIYLKDKDTAIKVYKILLTKIGKKVHIEKPSDTRYKGQFSISIVSSPDPMPYDVEQFIKKISLQYNPGKAIGYSEL